MSMFMYQSRNLKNICLKKLFLFINRKSFDHFDRNAGYQILKQWHLHVSYDVKKVTQESNQTQLSKVVINYFGDRCGSG